MRGFWDTGGIIELVLIEPLCLRTSCSIVKSMNLRSCYPKWNVISDTRGPMQVNALLLLRFNYLAHQKQNKFLWHLEKSPCITSIPCMLITYNLKSCQVLIIDLLLA